MTSRLSSVAAVALVLGGCASRPARVAAGGDPSNRGAPAAGGRAVPSGSEQPRTVTLEPVRIDVVTGAAGEGRAYDALTLLEEGNDALMQRRFDEAVVAYDHLVADFPDSQLAIAAIYNAGLALEGKGDFVAAAERYRDVVRRAPGDSRDALDGRFRLGAVLAEAERYTEAIPVFEALLDRPELEPTERIEALARLGYVLIEAKDYAGAEEILRSALRYHREVDAVERIENTYYVAMCQYYLADIPRRQFAAIPLRLPEAQLTRDIEQKSELFLLARDRYVKAIEYKNPYWATAAIHQIGATYKQFWDQFMALPIPPQLDPKAAKAYVETINKDQQLRRLLEKALLYHERNVAMAREARVSTPWSEGSAAAADEVRGILARQQRGDLITPGEAPGQVEVVEPARGGGEDLQVPEYVPSRLDL